MTAQPPEEEPVIDILSSDGTVLRQVPESLGIRFDALTDAMDQFSRSLRDFGATRGGLQFRWDISAYQQEDPRKGEEVYVYDILPGARVYVLEDVFTVDRVELDACPPTVWLKELPTSPLYFTEDEYIYLANETED